MYYNWPPSPKLVFKGPFWWYATEKWTQDAFKRIDGMQAVQKYLIPIPHLPPLENDWKSEQAGRLVFSYS